MYMAQRGFLRRCCRAYPRCLFRQPELGLERRILTKGEHAIALRTLIDPKIAPLISEHEQSRSMLAERPSNGSSTFGRRPTGPLNQIESKSGASNLMISFVPLDKAREPDLDRRFRLEAEIAARGFDVCKALRDIARL